MTEDSFKRMIKYMKHAWPGATQGWTSDEEVMKTWYRELLPYHDQLVRFAWRDLKGDRTRDQTWPPTLFQLIAQIEKTEKFYEGADDWDRWEKVIEERGERRKARLAASRNEADAT